MSEFKYLRYIVSAISSIGSELNTDLGKRRTKDVGGLGSLWKNTCTNWRYDGNALKYSGTYLHYCRDQSRGC